MRPGRNYDGYAVVVCEICLTISKDLFLQAVLWSSNTPGVALWAAQISTVGIRNPCRLTAWKDSPNGNQYQIYMNNRISIVGPIVVFYKYRTAKLANWSCCIPLTPSDMDYLRRKMSRNGLDLDNHIVFATEKSNFWYSDNNLYVGGTIVPGAY